MLNVVLFEPEIPGNTGNIMRTCVATHTRLHLIEPLGFSLEEKYIKRSGVNYIEHCDYTVYPNWEEFEKKNQGTYYFYNIYLIFGLESTGMPINILKPHLESCARIPMTDKVRALNLSNSVAIVLYEALRQQDYIDLLKDEPEDAGHKGNHFIEDYHEL